MDKPDYFLQPRYLKRAKAERERLRNKREEKGSPEHEGESFVAEECDWSASVVAVYSGLRVAVMHEGREIECLTDPAQRIVVGDVVGCRAIAGEIKVVSVMPRQSWISRLRGDKNREDQVEEHVLAANVERAIIVASVKNPAFHARFIDRYMVACQNGGVDPIVCLTKCDLTNERPSMLEWYRSQNIPIAEVSVMSGEGLDDLRDLLRDSTAVLLGASGVGKSSLINALVPDLKLATQETSQKTGKGKHTTTGSRRYEWAPGSYIIDTPGIRSLGLDHIPKEKIQFLFADFEPYLGSCKFSNCLHTHEPACAIKQAVEEGAIQPFRYESYVRMIQE